jgi:hypothetical protein
LALLAVTLGGCAKSSKVSGKITYDGKPLGAGKITFIGPDGKGSDPAEIEDGRYEVRNAPIGECTIIIETDYLLQVMGGGPMGPPGAKDFEKATDAKKKDQDKFLSGGKEFLPEYSKAQEKVKKYVQLPPKYWDKDKTDLKYTVKRGTQTGVDFAMEKGNFKPQKIPGVN